MMDAPAHRRTDAALRDEVLGKLERPLPALLVPGLVLLFLIGGSTFLLLALRSGSARAWHAYHVNWLFWTGLSQAGVLFSAVTNVTKGRWSFPVRRFAEACGAFLPVSLVLFLVLWLGRAEIFPWIRHPIEEPAVKAFWLRGWFLFARDVAGMLVLYGLSLWFLYHSLRPDVALLKAGAEGGRKKLYDWIARGWGARLSDAEEIARSEDRLSRIAPGLIVAYAIVMSLLAFDLIMSLAPHWLSNLLGGYFFMGAWLSGLMSLALLAIFWRRHLGLEDLVSPQTLHDLGKLGFAFTVFWAYLFFSQFLVIWYGNLPEETSFMFLRLAGQPWRGIAILMVILVFVVPFWGLIGVKPKKTPAVLATFATISLAGVWIDRYVFTVPSIVQAAPTLPLGWQELFVTAGFAGLWSLVYVWFARTFPIISPRLVVKMAEGGAGGH